MTRRRRRWLPSTVRFRRGAEQCNGRSRGPSLRGGEADAAIQGNHAAASGLLGLRLAMTAQIVRPHLVAKHSKGRRMESIRITAGSFRFTARFESTAAPKTCAKFASLLPYRE